MVYYLSLDALKLQILIILKNSQPLIPSAFLLPGLVLAILGSFVGAAMVVSEKRNTPTERPQRDKPSSKSQRLSRKELFLPMASLLGVSVLLLIIGYTT